jgi:acetoacetyl-CoA synthetase
MNDQQPLWTPSQASIDAANMTAFIAQVNRTRGLSIAGYDALYQWSIDSKEDFWSEVWDFCGIIGDKGERILVDGDDIEKAQWFPDASLNFAENLLRRKTDDIAIHFRAEDQADYGLTYRQLYEQVASVAAWLKSNGLQPGDRVAAYLPNMPEAVVAMLAATSLGAVWTSTSPDFGVDSVVDRFGQTEPRFLFTVDGYFYNGKRHQISDKIDDICSQVGSIEQVVQVDLAGFGNRIDAVDWREIVARPADGIDFVPRNFNDPLYVLYSSGTTGKPKCITHKVGGTLIQHLKEHMLHCDLHPGDRVFYFTTLGWMMWNWLVSALGLAVLSGWRSAMALRRGYRPDLLRHLGQVHRRDEKRGTQTDGQVRPVGLTHDRLHRLGTGAGELRLRLRKHQAGSLPGVGVGRHRYRFLFCHQLSAAARVSRRSAVPRARPGGRRIRRRRQFAA